MFCEGLAAENYELYVAGNAEEEVRREIDAHLDQNCPACFRGVQRGIALWTTYAASLQAAERSAPLRSRLIALGTLTRQVIGFRAGSNLAAFGSRGIYGLVAASVAILVGLGAWYAGVQYANLHGQQVLAELSDAQQSASELQTKLVAEIRKRQQLEEALKRNGQPNTTGQLQAVQQQVLRLQAEVNQYRDAIERERKNMGDNVQLVALLSTPGVRLITLHGQESTPGAVGYSLTLEDKKLVFIASHLPKPAAGKEYQLWLLRETDPKVVSGGTFDPEDSGQAVLEFSSGQLVSELSAVAVTEEPMGGSEGPTGPKLLAGTPDAN